MKEDFISKAFNKNTKNRFLLFDEINDCVESDLYDKCLVDEIIKKILKDLPHEVDINVHESMMNILSSVYLDSSLSDEIEEYIIDNIEGMNKNSIFHALSIISESNLENRFDLLRYFSQKGDKAVSDFSKELLSVIEKNS